MSAGAAGAPASRERRAGCPRCSSPVGLSGGAPVTSAQAVGPSPTPRPCASGAVFHSLWGQSQNPWECYPRLLRARPGDPGRPKSLLPRGERPVSGTDRELRARGPKSSPKEVTSEARTGRGKGPARRGSGRVAGRRLRKPAVFGNWEKVQSRLQPSEQGNELQCVFLGRYTEK